MTALRLCFVAFVILHASLFYPPLLIGQLEFEAADFALAAGKLGFVAFTLTTAITGYFARSPAPIERGLILVFR